jgi:hypothetical protein
VHLARKFFFRFVFRNLRLLKDSIRPDERREVSWFEGDGDGRNEQLSKKIFLNFIITKEESFENIF